MSIGISTMEIDVILEFLNKNSEKYLGAISPGIKVEINGAKCTIVRDNLKGGILVFSPIGVPRFKWNKENKKWVYVSGY